MPEKQAHEAELQAEPAEESKKLPGNFVANKLVVIEPVVTQFGVEFTPPEILLPRLTSSPDTMKPAARETAKKVADLVENQAGVVINENEAPGVTLLVTTEKDCSAEFSAVNDNPHKPKTTTISATIYGAKHLVDKVINDPVTEETTDLLYSDQIGHADTLGLGTIVVEPGKKGSLKAAANKVSKMADTVCMEE